jgi:hypothetical protein
MVLVTIALLTVTGCEREPQERYQLADNGLRLDTVTGQVDRCYPTDDPHRWRCGANVMTEEDWQKFADEIAKREAEKERQWLLDEADRIAEEDEEHD